MATSSTGFYSRSWFSPLGGSTRSKRRCCFASRLAIHKRDQTTSLLTVICALRTGQFHRVSILTQTPPAGRLPWLTIGAGFPGTRRTGDLRRPLKARITFSASFAASISACVGRSRHEEHHHHSFGHRRDSTSAILPERGRARRILVRRGETGERRAASRCGRFLPCPGTRLGSANGGLSPDEGF